MDSKSRLSNCIEESLVFIESIHSNWNIQNALFNQDIVIDDLIDKKYLIFIWNAENENSENSCIWLGELKTYILLLMALFKVGVFFRR